jgi:tetratricopeptide (TPR) repeat protein
LDDPAKVTEWSEKTIRFKPDDIRSLMMLSNVIAERPPRNEAEETKQMKRAEELANRALTMLPVYLATEGAAIPADLKGELTGEAHSILGLIYLRQKKLSLSQQEFLIAIKFKPMDPVPYYRLGMAYREDKKTHLAMEALGKSVCLKGASETEARDMLKQLYLSENRSETGLEDYIKVCGARIGQ